MPLIKKAIIFWNSIIESEKKRSKSLLIYNLNYTVYGEYPSIMERAKSLNCNGKTIRRTF